MAADHKKPLDGALFLVSQLVLIILSIPTFIPKPLKVSGFVVVGWYFCRIIFTQTTGDFSNDFGLGTAAVFLYIVNLDYALLTPPEILRDLQDKNPTKVTERSLERRILWTLKLFSNPRCIGWAHEPSYLPPRPSPSTPCSRFVVSRLLHATCCFFIVGGTSLFDATYVDKLLTAAPLHQRALGVLSFGLGVLCMISGINAILSATTVGCGLSIPERWPQLFGSPLQAWSIRRFWRRCWHQLMRRSLLTCTSSLLGRIFPAKYIGTPGYKFVQLCVVFCISGLAHASGEVMAVGKLRFKALTFFMLQPFGIVFELVVSRVWYRLQVDGANRKNFTASEGTRSTERVHENLYKHHPLADDSMPPLWIRCIGYIWVALWMVWTAAYMADAGNSARLSVQPGQI